MSLSLQTTNACKDLFALLEKRTFQNLQLGARENGIIKKQTIINLDEENEIIGASVHFYQAKGFDFEVHLLSQSKFEIEITKTSGNMDNDVNFALAEIVRLRNAAKERELSQGGSSKGQVGLYLQSGAISTDTSKMRFIQAVLDQTLPFDYLMKCKDRDFKFVGKGIGDLTNWKDEAKRLGIKF